MDIYTYIIAITLLTLTPGADTMLIIRNTARGGWQDGFLSSIGICTGLFVHATVSAVGISVILLKTAWAFSALKLMGACYLIWLGACNLREVFKKSHQVTGEDSGSGPARLYIFRSLREGFLSNFLNPKTAVFYLAFLPQFIYPEGSALAQSLMLAGIHFVIAMIWQCFLALTVDQAKLLLQKPKFGKVFGGVTGSVMIFLGITLAVND